MVGAARIHTRLLDLTEVWHSLRAVPHLTRRVAELERELVSTRAIVDEHHLGKTKEAHRA